MSGRDGIAIIIDDKDARIVELEDNLRHAEGETREWHRISDAMTDQAAELRGKLTISEALVQELAEALGPIETYLFDRQYMPDIGETEAMNILRLRTPALEALAKTPKSMRKETITDLRAKLTVYEASYQRQLSEWYDKLTAADKQLAASEKRVQRLEVALEKLIKWHETCDDPTGSTAEECADARDAMKKTPEKGG